MDSLRRKSRFVHNKLEGTHDPPVSSSCLTEPLRVLSGQQLSCTIDFVKVVSP